MCRAKINSVWVPGQLRPQKSVCVVSLYKKVSEYKQFEVLVSIESSSRLSWVHKDKYTLTAQGAVTSGDNVLKTYIARRSANSHNMDGSLTHLVGKYVPSENLGVFYLVDQNNDEFRVEDGEILVETEPIEYEFKSIKLERHRGRYPKQLRELGHAILKNEENSLQHVASVITYTYDYSLYWGKGHGILTGLPFNVTLPNGTVIQGSWGMPREEERSETAPVEKYLEPGTAVNVTLYGNYTESEIPYNATVVAVYKDKETREINIRDTKRENLMKDVVAHFSPVYFIHNNSHVPTTTTTTQATTTTISSTTSRTTSTTQEIAPIVQPETSTAGKSVEDKRQKDGDMLSDEQKTAQVTKTNAPSQKDAAPVATVFNVFSILGVVLVVLRVS